MRIWKVMYDQNYENMIYKDKRFLNFFDKNFKGEKINDYSEIIEIKTAFKGTKAEKGKVRDVSSLGSIPVFSKRVVELFKDKLQESVQYIKLNHDIHGECYAVNVIKVLDCVDEEKSIIDRMPSGKIFKILKYAFKKDILYPPIFKIVTNGRIGIFVTDDFIEEIEKNKVIGLRCKLIWDSQEVYR